MDRRAFLASVAVALGAPVSGAAALPATLRIGLVLPGSPTGESLARGAELGLADANALTTLFGARLELVRETAGGTEAAREAGRRLAREAAPLALVGGADDAAAEGLRDAAREGALPFFNVGAWGDRLRGEGCDRYAYHLFPSLAMHVGAVGLWLLEERRLPRWLLLVGPGETGSAVAAAVRAVLARHGGTLLGTVSVPAGLADWAPVLGRVRSAAPDAVVAGVEAGDLPGFLRAWRAHAPGPELAVVASDPGWVAAAPDEVAGVWPLVWHPDLERFSARELNGRFRRRFGRPLDGPAWAAWAAVKLLGEAVVRGRATDGAGVARFVAGAPPFDGHKGRPLTFREWDHQLRQPLYVARPRPQAAPGRPGLEVVAEVPRGDADRLAPPREESPCRLGR